MLLFLVSNIKIFLYLFDDLLIVNRLRFLNIKSKHFLINPIKDFNTLYKKLFFLLNALYVLVNYSFLIPLIK